MRKAILEAKLRLKMLAKEIHDLRATRKKMPNGVVPGLAEKSHEARYRHIAYCLIRGKTMEQIEKPRDTNKPYMYLVEVYLKEIRAAEPVVVVNELPEVKADEQEAVCSGARGSVANAKDGSILSRCGRALSSLLGAVGK